MEHATWTKATELSAGPGHANLLINIARMLAAVVFKTPACHKFTHNIHYLTALLKFIFMRCLLGSMFVGALKIRASGVAVKQSNPFQGKRRGARNGCDGPGVKYSVSFEPGSNSTVVY
jgi:hypothetical protein